MEGSVKSLIEAEEEAHKIVQQAEKEKTEKVKDAHQMAAQILNAKEKEYKAKYEQEERHVSRKSIAKKHIRKIDDLTPSLENDRARRTLIDGLGSSCRNWVDEFQIRTQQESRDWLSS